jgi:hypothetical protein
MPWRDSFNSLDVAITNGANAQENTSIKQPLVVRVEID